jgi:threonine/homoserine/homoserine lactone efflux protein
MGILTALVNNKIPDANQKFDFFASIFSIVVITDIIKIYLSKKIKHFLKSPTSLYNLQKAIGIILIVLGTVLIIRGSLN